MKGLFHRVSFLRSTSRILSITFFCVTNRNHIINGYSMHNYVKFIEILERTQTKIIIVILVLEAHNWMLLVYLLAYQIDLTEITNMNYIYFSSRVISLLNLKPTKIYFTFLCININIFAVIFLGMH